MKVKPYHLVFLFFLLNVPASKTQVCVTSINFIQTEVCVIFINCKKAQVCVTYINYSVCAHVCLRKTNKKLIYLGT